MKYVKPEAEIIDIENKDIVTASTCLGNPGTNCNGGTGSDVCAKNGVVNSNHTYNSMVQAGYCSGSTGRYDTGNGTIVCYQISGQGRLGGSSIICNALWGGNDNEKCSVVAGFNSL